MLSGYQMQNKQKVETLTQLELEQYRIEHEENFDGYTDRINDICDKFKYNGK